MPKNSREQGEMERQKALAIKLLNQLHSLEAMKRARAWVEAVWINEPDK